MYPLHLTPFHPSHLLAITSEYSKTLNDVRLKVLAAREVAIQVNLVLASCLRHTGSSSAL